MLRLIAIVALFVLPSAGCSFTSMAWEQVGDDRLTIERIDGTIAATDDRPEQLVISYSAGYASPEKFYLLPLNAEGLPDERLVYRGDKRRLNWIGLDFAQHATRSQLEAVLPKKSVGLKSSIESPGFQELSTRDVGPWFGKDSPTLLFADGSGEADFFIAAVRQNNDGVLEPAVGGVNSGIIFPEDCKLIVLPTTRKRPAGELGRARLKAGLLTPFTITLDVVTIPFVLIMVATGHGC